VAGISGCFNCEEHINNDIKPMFVKAKGLQLSTRYNIVHLVTIFLSQKLEEQSISISMAAVILMF
jgi:hypothetical protein